MSFADHNYRPLMFLVLESGAVYSLTLTALLVLYKCESWFQYVLVDAVSVDLLRKAFQLGHLQFIYADFTHRRPCLLHDYHLHWSRHDQFRRDIVDTFESIEQMSVQSVKSTEDFTISQGNQRCECLC